MLTAFDKVVSIQSIRLYFHHICRGQMVVEQAFPLVGDFLLFFSILDGRLACRCFGAVRGFRCLQQPRLGTEDVSCFRACFGVIDGNNAVSYEEAALAVRGHDLRQDIFHLALADLAARVFFIHRQFHRSNLKPKNIEQVFYYGAGFAPGGVGFVDLFREPFFQSFSGRDRGNDLCAAVLVRNL